jgi:hypothetical protein
MSLNEQTGYLNIDNAHLRVEGNIVAENIELGNIQIGPTYGLSSVTDVGNTTSQTVQFTNAATGLVTTGNVTVGKELTVSGNVTMSEELTVSGNVEMTGTGALTLPTGTTAQQPTGVEGMVRFNTTTNRMEFYSGTVWNTISGYDSVTASGGSINDVTVDGKMYRTHTFSTVGTSSFIVTNGGNVECLIVAGGGGGGGRYHAGGGGGGGVIQLTNVDVTPTTYSIVVGDGGDSGLATPASSSRGTNGQDSTAFGYTAIGGGGGGSNDTYYTGLNGGSGGGGSGSSNNASHESGDGTSGQGHRGGIGLGSSTVGAERVGGGGGGAGGRGMHAAAYRTRDPGDGGPGIPSTISGTLAYYGPGGGGGGEAETTNMGLGGIGGGGNGGNGSRIETAGEDGKGGGGGGSNSSINGVGNGGSGVVIIRYRL